MTGKERGSLKGYHGDTNDLRVIATTVMGTTEGEYHTPVQQLVYGLSLSSSF